MVSKNAKLRERILSGHSNANIDFGDLCQLVLLLGFTKTRISGSHRIFQRHGVAKSINLQPGKDGKAKPYQVKEVKKIVEEFNL